MQPTSQAVSGTIAEPASSDYTSWSRTQLLSRIHELEAQLAEDQKRYAAMKDNLYRGFNCLWNILDEACDEQELRELMARFQISYDPEDKMKSEKQLANQLLQPEEMSKQALYMTDWEEPLFSLCASYAGCDYAPGNEEEAAILKNIEMEYYLFSTNNAKKYSVPIDAGDAWQRLNTPAFSQKRSRCSYIYACTRMIPTFYVIMPVTAFASMVRLYPACRDMSDDEIIKVVEEIPEDLREAKLDDNRKWVQSMVDEPADFLDMLTRNIAYIPYYLFTPDEVQEFTVYGYPHREPRLLHAQQFLKEHLHSSDSQAEEIVEALWNDATDRKTTGQDEILDALSDQDQEKWESFITRIQRNTRSWAFHGHTYNEYLKWKR